ncbi:MAG: alpha-L-rhamnosidase N-terminal domain-containing protein [Thermofilaceae archaeon]
MNPDDWKRAKWIGGGQYIRKEFEIRKKIAEARIYITGLGYYELRVNGEKIGDRILDPPWSDYDKIVYYSVYDVTHCIRSGLNAVGIVLGWGRYASRFKPREGIMIRGINTMMNQRLFSC